MSNLFAVPVSTAGLAGFPDLVHSIAEARRAVAQARMPVIRSQPAWLDAYNRLTLAEAAPTFQHHEAARIALHFAIVQERRGGAHTHEYGRTTLARAA